MIYSLRREELRISYYIKDAQFRRTEEHSGRPCAVVQVKPGAVNDPELFVYLARAKNEEGFEIIKMISSDADLEIDWYDNSMHQAYAVVPEELFGNQGWPEPTVQRKQFLQNLLSLEDIAAKLEEQLPRV